MAKLGLKKPDQKQPPDRMSRREMLFGASVAAAGVVAGSAVGYAAPRKKAPSPAVPDLWIGRNIDDCTGCRLCQVACSVAKEDKIQPSIARVTVYQFYPGVEFPVLCYQCGDDAKCVEACPVEALSVDPSKKLNTIAIDTSRCLRTAKGGDCTLCQDECPGTAVTYHPTTKAPLICDLCGGDPACVKSCPSSTITTRGIKMAAVKPIQIAGGLIEKYKVPPSPDAPVARPLTPEG